MKIFKYDIPAIEKEFSLEIPNGGKILCIQMQPSYYDMSFPKMWVLVDDNEDTVERQFLIVGTGHKFDPSNMKYISTYQDNGFVWHVFERIV